MSRCIAFLRAVNVGGRTVRMDALRAAFESIGLKRAETFIASGNVVFDSRAPDLASLERKIEGHLERTFGFEIHTFIRSADELAAVVDHRAFEPEDVSGAATHVVGFMANAPSADALRAIDAFENEIDRFRVHGRELHWLSTQRQSESTFSNVRLEKVLAMRSTFRSMSTLRKLLAKYPVGR